MLHQGQDAVTEALTDPDTRKEMKQLVNDLVSLLSVIVEEAVPRPAIVLPPITDPADDLDVFRPANLPRPDEQRPGTLERFQRIAARFAQRMKENEEKEQSSSPTRPRTRRGAIRAAPCAWRARRRSVCDGNLDTLLGGQLRVGYTVDGEPLVAYTASRTEHSVTVRKIGATRGGQRYSTEVFDETFGATGEEAIEKYIAQQQFLLSQARHDVEALELIIRRAEALRSERYSRRACRTTRRWRRWGR